MPQSYVYITVCVCIHSMYVCVCIYSEIMYYKELANGIMGTGKSKSAVWAGRWRHRKADYADEVPKWSAGEFLLLWGTLVFLLCSGLQLTK